MDNYAFASDNFQNLLPVCARRLGRELKKEAMMHLLRHPSIVALLGVVFESGHYGVVQQFVKYKGLDHLCEEYKASRFID